MVAESEYLRIRMAPIIRVRFLGDIKKYFRKFRWERFVLTKEVCLLQTLQYKDGNQVEKEKNYRK